MWGGLEDLGSADKGLERQMTKGFSVPLNTFSIDDDHRDTKILLHAAGVGYCILAVGFSSSLDLDAKDDGTGVEFRIDPATQITEDEIWVPNFLLLAAIELLARKSNVMVVGNTHLIQHASDPQLFLVLVPSTVVQVILVTHHLAAVQHAIHFYAVRQVLHGCNAWRRQRNNCTVWFESKPPC